MMIQHDSLTCLYLTNGNLDKTRNDEKGSIYQSILSKPIHFDMPISQISEMLLSQIWRIVYKWSSLIFNKIHLCNC